MKRYLYILILLVFFLPACGPWPGSGAGQLMAKEELLLECSTKIEGYITRLDPANALIFIDGEKYQLAREVLVSLNGGPSTLLALKPPAPGFIIGESFIWMSGIGATNRCLLSGC